MKILVTGGAGFIGSHLVDRLSQKHTVFVIDDMSGGSIDNANHRAITYAFDLRNAKTAERLIGDIKPDVVYHLAANAAENKAQFSPIDITSRNWNTFINTLVPFINNGGKRFIFTSSIAVYGNLMKRFDELDRPEPEDLYGVSKYAIEQALSIMSKVHDFEYVIARPHNVYGPRQNMSDPYRNVVTIFMNSILKGKPYYIYGDGEQARCFTYISDVVDALADCLDVPSGMTFNVGADKDYTINELSDAIIKATGTDLRPVHIKDRPQEVKWATADHTLAKKHLNYKDRVSLEDGIAMTWDWCKGMGPQEVLFTEPEIRSDKLPENWK